MVQIPESFDARPNLASVTPDRDDRNVQHREQPDEGPERTARLANFDVHSPRCFKRPCDLFIEAVKWRWFFSYVFQK